MPKTLPDPTSSLTAQSLSLRFRLIHLVYAVTLLATSLGTFGAVGLGPGVSFLLFWTVVFGHASRPKGLLVAFGLVIVGCGCAGLLLPAFSSAREAARRMSCSNNMKQIALALHNYHDVYKCFPPAYVPDENGKPMHSWRVLILPYMEQQPLYNAYHFDEPWDGPNNGKLLTQLRYGYSCPSQNWRAQTPRTVTDYVAVVGPSTAWPGPVGRKLSDLSDPASDTILILEATGHDIAWMEPRDFTFAEAMQFVTPSTGEEAGGHRREDFFHFFSLGRNVALTDGSVHFIIDGSLARDVWSSLLTVDDGVPVRDEELRPAEVPSRLKIGNCIRLGVWIVLVLFPLPWVWLNPYGAAVARSTHEQGSA